MNIPSHIKYYINAFEVGELPHDEQIELFQFLLDTDLHLTLDGPDDNPDLYRKTAEYYVQEGFCYFVPSP